MSRITDQVLTELQTRPLAALPAASGARVGQAVARLGATIQDVSARAVQMEAEKEATEARSSVRERLGELEVELAGVASPTERNRILDRKLPQIRDQALGGLKTGPGRRQAEPAIRDAISRFGAEAQVNSARQVLRETREQFDLMTQDTGVRLGTTTDESQRLALMSEFGQKVNNLVEIGALTGPEAAMATEAMGRFEAETRVRLLLTSDNPDDARMAVQIAPQTGKPELIGASSRRLVLLEGRRELSRTQIEYDRGVQQQVNDSLIDPSVQGFDSAADAIRGLADTAAESAAGQNQPQAASDLSRDGVLQLQSLAEDTIHSLIAQDDLDGAERVLASAQERGVMGGRTDEMVRAIDRARNQAFSRSSSDLADELTNRIIRAELDPAAPFPTKDRIDQAGPDADGTLTTRDHSRVLTRWGQAMRGRLKTTRQTSLVRGVLGGPQPISIAALPENDGEDYIAGLNSVMDREQDPAGKVALGLLSFRQSGYMPPQLISTLAFDLTSGDGDRMQFGMRALRRVMDETGGRAAASANGDPVGLLDGRTQAQLQFALSLSDPRFNARPNFENIAEQVAKSARIDPAILAERVESYEQEFQQNRQKFGLLFFDRSMLDEYERRTRELWVNTTISSDAIDDTVRGQIKQAKEEAVVELTDGLGVFNSPRKQVFPGLGEYDENAMRLDIASAVGMAHINGRIEDRAVNTVVKDNLPNRGLLAVQARDRVFENTARALLEEDRFKALFPVAPGTQAGLPLVESARLRRAKEWIAQAVTPVTPEDFQSGAAQAQIEGDLTDALRRRLGSDAPGSLDLALTTSPQGYERAVGQVLRPWADRNLAVAPSLSNESRLGPPAWDLVVRSKAARPDAGSGRHFLLVTRPPRLEGELATTIPASIRFDFADSVVAPVMIDRAGRRISEVQYQDALQRLDREAVDQTSLFQPREPDRGDIVEGVSALGQSPVPQ